jgi:2-haloacid dehalogenase
MHPSSGPRSASAVVFDLGGVLIDWDPRHLYRQLFDDLDEMERFLAEVTTAEWNLQQDAGRPFAEAVALLIEAHPERRELIEAFHTRWPEMLAGAIDEAVQVLADVHAAGVPVYALSNWSAETFPLTHDRFPFLDWFDGVVISGELGVVKPDPRIFQHLIDRFGLVPRQSVFIDDQPANVEAAARLGFTAIQFVNAAQLRRELEALGLLGPGKDGAG